jgi:hypothetical protein
VLRSACAVSTDRLILHPLSRCNDAETTLAAGVESDIVRAGCFCCDDGVGPEVCARSGAAGRRAGISRPLWCRHVAGVRACAKWNETGEDSVDVVLGVAVTGPVAHLTLAGSDGLDVIDEFALDVSDHPTETLMSTIVGTHQSFLASGHRLVATRMCWGGDGRADDLRGALSVAGVANVSVGSDTEAATALVRAAGPSNSALLFVDDDTATLSIVGADEVTTGVVAAEPTQGLGTVGACTALLQRLREEPGAATGVFLVGATAEIAGVADQLRPHSPLPLEIAEEPEFALARGAARAAAGTLAASSVNTLGPAPVPARGGLGSLEVVMSATAGAATAQSPQLGSQLAYSLAPDSGPLPLDLSEVEGAGAVPLQNAMPPLSQASDPDEFDDTVVAGGPATRPRVLLLGSTVAAVVVVGFAALAVTVAIQIRPAVNAEPLLQRVEEIPTAPVPGNYGPKLDIPEAAVPVPPAPPQVESVPVGNSVPTSGGIPSSSGGGGGAPAPGNVPLPPPPEGGPPPVVDAPAPQGGLPMPGPFQLPSFQWPNITINLPTGQQPGTGTQDQPQTDGKESGSTDPGNTGPAASGPSTGEPDTAPGTTGTGKTGSGNGPPLDNSRGTDPKNQTPPVPDPPQPAAPVVVPDPPKPVAPVVVPDPPKPVAPVVVPDPPKPAPVVVPAPAPEPAPAPAPAPIQLPKIDLPFLGGGSGSGSSGGSSSGSSDSGSSSGSDSTPQTTFEMPKLQLPFLGGGG